MSDRKRLTIFFPFRSFHNQTFDYKLIFFLILPIFFNLIVLFNLHQITAFWTYVLNFFIANLQLNATVTTIKYTIFDVNFLLPAIDMFADMPGPEIWWTSIIINIALFVFSFFISDSLMPFKYFLRVFICILWITQIFFLVYPLSFPYNIKLYTISGFLQILSLLFATPWLYAFTYYLFGYHLLRKILITTFVLLYFIVLAPFQYLLNAVIISNYSLLFMPVLYLFAGLLLNVFSIVAFYAYGVSLVYTSPKYKQSH